MLIVVEDGETEQDDQLEPVLASVARTEMVNLKLWEAVVPVSSLKMKVIPEIERSPVGITHEGTTFPLIDGPGSKKLLGLPFRTFDPFKDNAGLMVKMMQHCMERHAGEEVRLCGSESAIYALYPADEPYVDPMRVFDLLVEELGGDETLVDLIAFSKAKLYVRFLSAWAAAPAKKKDDVSHAGLLLRMNGSLDLGPYSHRMVCNNGLMRSFVKMKKIDRTESDWEANVLDAANVAQSEAIHLTTSLCSLNTQKIGADNLLAQFTRMGKQFRLSPGLITEAVERVSDLPTSPTMYDVVNLLSEINRDKKSSEGEMMRLGNMAVTLSNNARCNNCGTVLINGEEA